MAIPFIRAVQDEDFEQIHALAQLTGGGMTNLPMDKKTLRSRIDFAIASYGQQAKAPGSEVYMLVLEKDGRVAGTAAVFSSIGLESGFVNYRINVMFHYSEQVGKRVARRVLVPTYDYTGMSEVGSLFISPQVRGGGFGKLLARSRYSFIAQAPEIFSEKICAELRGWRSDDGAQPFWNAVGRHFFDMEFETADQHNAKKGNQFISDLMPPYPIYIALLPKDARDAIAKPHRDAKPAYNMLVKEGFEFNNYVDIFDGGPVVECKTADISAIKNSRVYKVKSAGDETAQGAKPNDIMAASGSRATFRAIRSSILHDETYAYLDSEQKRALNIVDGDKIRVTDWAF